MIWFLLVFVVGEIIMESVAEKRQWGLLSRFVVGAVLLIVTVLGASWYQT